MTLQLLFPMGGLGTRFAQIGIPTPKPLIPVDGQPMVLKALSSFSDLLQMSCEREHGTSSLNVRVVFVIRTEHERDFGLRTKLLEAFQSQYGCQEFWCVNEKMEDNTPSLMAAPSSGIASASQIRNKMSVYFVMMHADTRGAAETCLLARPALIPSSPLVIMDCDLYVHSTILNRVLLAMTQGNRSDTSTRDPETDSQASSATSKNIPGHILSSLRGALVFFNSRAPRYSYAIVEPISGLDLSDPTGKLTAGGRVTRTAEKIPISNCSLIGAYTFAAAGWFVAAAKRLIEQPINPDSGLKEYYISLLYNFLLDPSFRPEGFTLAETNKLSDEDISTKVYVLAVPKEGYGSFGTPEELKNYNEGLDPYVKE